MSLFKLKPANPNLMIALAISNLIILANPQLIMLANLTIINLMMMMLLTIFGWILLMSFLLSLHCHQNQSSCLAQVKGKSPMQLLILVIFTSLYASGQLAINVHTKC